MVQIKTLMTASLGFAIASCTPIVGRSAAAVLADLATISTDIAGLTTAVTGYSGGLTGALTIATAEATLDTDTNKATTDANAAAAFSVADSTSVVEAIVQLTPAITTGLSDLASKEPLFNASGLDSLVLSLLTTLKADNDALGAALQAKAQPSDVATLQTLQGLIDSAFATTLAAF